MSNSSDIRRGRSCVFDLHVHLVFVTKYRRCVFARQAMRALEGLFSGVCEDFGAELVEFDGEKDHVHLLVHYPPTVQLSKLVNSLKGVSSRRLRKEVPEVARHYWKNQLWSPSYFAGSCGGAPIEVVRQYIEQQNSPH